MLFRKNIHQFCSYCSHAAKIDEHTFLCKKKGMVSSSHHCRRFRYDPLKRIPARMNPKDFAKLDEEDFSL